MVRTHRRTSRHDPLQGGNWFQIPETVSLLNTVYKQVETKAQNRGPTTHKDVFGLFQLLKISVQNASESIKRLVPIIFMSFVYHTFPVAWARAFNSKYGILGLKEQSVLHNLILQKNKEKVLSAQKVEQSDTDYAFYLFDFLETMDATHSHLEGGFEWPEWFTLPRNYQLLKAIKEEVAVAAKTVTKTEATTLDPEPGFVPRIRSLFTQLTTSVRSRSTSVINWVKIMFMAFVYSVFPRKWAKYINEKVGILDKSAADQMLKFTQLNEYETFFEDYKQDFAFLNFEILQLKLQFRKIVKRTEFPNNNNNIMKLFQQKGIKNVLVDDFSALFGQTVLRATFETAEKKMKTSRRNYKENPTLESFKNVLDAENETLHSDFLKKSFDLRLAKVKNIPNQSEIQRATQNEKDVFNRIITILENRASLVSNVQVAQRALNDALTTLKDIFRNKDKSQGDFTIMNKELKLAYISITNNNNIAEQFAKAHEIELNAPLDDVKIAWKIAYGTTLTAAIAKAILEDMGIDVDTSSDQ